MSDSSLSCSSSSSSNTSSSSSSLSALNSGVSSSSCSASDFALNFLRTRNIPFSIHQYSYIEKGGTNASSSALGVDEHSVVKTLVFEERNSKQPLIVLQHGDCVVDAKLLSAAHGCKVSTCSPDAAFAATGMIVGGTSPFGLRSSMPIYVEASILNVPGNIFINGGARGLLINIHPLVLIEHLKAKPVQVAKMKDAKKAATIGEFNVNTHPNIAEGTSSGEQIIALRNEK